MNDPSVLVRQCFAAYESKDRAALEAIIADDFTFTSPLDDHINRALYFERCWPNSEHLARFRIERLFAQGNEVFAQYEAETTSGERFRNTEHFKVRDGKIVEVCVYFGRETGESASKEEIRSMVEAWAAAIRRKDVDGVLRSFAADSVRFSLSPPLQATRPLRANLEEWFATFEGNIAYEMRELAITTSTKLAYCHSFNRIAGRKVAGGNIDLWFRETLCLRQIHGHWLIVHTHESVPFYMDGSDRAAVDLQP